MQSSDTPEKISLPFADTGAKRDIPIPSQVSITPGAASFETGFPPKTFTPIALGGIPPDGEDFNGLFNRITDIQRWQSAGGLFKFDAAFAAEIGGYPKGAFLANTGGDDAWANTVEGNTTNPDSGGADWELVSMRGLLSNYTALRAYAGKRTVVTLTNNGIAGTFRRDDADTTSADNGGTIIVSASGVRWKRQFSGYIYDSWFGAVSGGDATAAIQAAIDFGIASNTGVKVTVNASATKLTVQNAAYNFTLEGENAIISGVSATPQEGLLEIINCVSMPVKNFHLSCANNPNYQSALRVKAIAGTSQAVSRVSFEDITVLDAKLALWVGTADIDFQCSEITFTNCHAFRCPQYLYGAGSQSGAVFIGCNMVAEANAAFPGTGLRVALAEGGFWYTDGSELVQTSAAPGDVLIEARPCVSALYSNPYPKWVSTGGHIESSGVLLYVNNINALANPRSNASSFSFSNVGGYIPSAGPNVVDTTGDNDYAGKIVFDATCDFYGNVDGAGVSIDRVAPHIVLGTKTKIDMDGAPFGQSFKQGLSGVSPTFRGKQRLRGQTILSRNSSVTVVGTGPVGTVIAFPVSQVTDDTAYGDPIYTGSAFVPDQDMKNVQIDYQLGFLTAAPLADVWVAVAGVSTGLFAVKVSDNVRAGSVTLPVLAQGQAVTILANTNTGAPIALTGGASNFVRIRASTQ